MNEYTKSRLDGIVADFKNDLDNAFSAQYREICDNADRAAAIPALDDTTLEGAYLDRARAAESRARARIDAAVGYDLRTMREKVAAAPSQDALNAMQAVSMRGSYSLAELEAMHDLYGNNASVDAFIREKANARGYAWTRPASDAQEKLAAFEKAVSTAKAQCSYKQGNTAAQARARAVKVDYVSRLFS